MGLVGLDTQGVWDVSIYLVYGEWIYGTCVERVQYIV